MDFRWCLQKHTCLHVWVCALCAGGGRERVYQNSVIFWKAMFLNTWNRKISFKPLTNIYCTTYRVSTNISPKGARLDCQIFSNMLPAAFKQQDNFDSSSSIIPTHSSWMRDYNITTHCVKIWLQSSMCVWKLISY